ncbi:restriction endonuclease subunit S [Kordia zhangzhouensis]|uniref:restriction endonuclease subunit S n=1 Tax=Kordia zhangzhouensis TaxID=1620405 RepID=UPI000629315E|nr:restriction endonuclease subunit S [Kordia zhangzhouensis]
MQKDINKIPQLRFSEFTEDWERKKYNEIYSFYSTNSLSRDKLNYEKGEVKNIHYGDIHTKFSTLFDITNELVPFIDSDVDLTKIKEESYLKNGDLLIADASEDYNDIGKTIEVVNLNNEKVISGLHTFHARPNKHKMIIGFSGFMLQNWNVRKQVMKIAQGTKVLGLATSRLGKIKLHIPSLKEQKKIASFLSSVDTKLNLLQQKKERLEQYKKGVMQQIFSQQLRFTDDDGSSFADWEEKRLGDIAVKESSNISANSIEENTGNYKIYGASGFIKKIDFYLQEQPYISIVKDGAGVGRTLLCDAESSVLGTLDVIKPKVNANLYFIYSLLNNINFTKYIIGSTIPHIYFKDYSKEKIQIPSLKEQTKIATFLSAIDNKIALVAIQIENTQQFKKGLLQQMFV